MDFLKAEIERKRKAQQDLLKATKTKYIRRGDLQDDVETPESENPAANSKIEDKPAPAKIIPSNKVETKETVKIDESLIRQRFRAKGHPVLLFGESYEERIARLEKVELEEPHAQLSYAEKLQLAGKNMTEELSKGEVGVEIDRDTALMNQILAIDTSGISIDLFRTDSAHCNYLIIIYFKKLLYEWERQLHKKSNQEKQQNSWIIESANQAQTAESMRPLFKQLKKGKIPGDVVERICQMCYYAQLRDYMKASDSYLALSIGNAAWPIGITGVALHERKGNDKIASSEIPHVLNDEVKRKVILP